MGHVTLTTPLTGGLGLEIGEKYLRTNTFDDVYYDDSPITQSDGC